MNVADLSFDGQTLILLDAFDDPSLLNIGREPEQRRCGSAQNGAVTTRWTSDSCGSRLTAAGGSLAFEDFVL